MEGKPGSLFEFSSNSPDRPRAQVTSFYEYLLQNFQSLLVVMVSAILASPSDREEEKRNKLLLSLLFKSSRSSSDLGLSVGDCGLGG